jgi:peroxiredoxin
MMKTILSIVFLSSILFMACKNKSNPLKKGEMFVVQGTINNFIYDTIYLGEMKRPDSTPIVVDTFILKGDGKIKMEAIANEVGLYCLIAKEVGFDGKQGLYPVLFFVNDQKEVNFSMDYKERKSLKFTNSEASNNMVQYFVKIDSVKRFITKANSTMDSLQKKKRLDTLAITALSNQLETTYNTHSANIRNEFAKIKYGVLANFYFLVANQANALTLADKNAVRLDLIKRFPAQTQTKAPNFTMDDPSGKKISISQFKGKYVLIDFWASWCEPCRKENPNVVAAYKKYKDKNFTILGVSLDEDAEAWKKAIIEDGLTWEHMSDLKSWETPIRAAYDFESIPYNVLVDPDGNIIASSLRGEDLLKTLEELLNKK